VTGLELAYQRLGFSMAASLLVSALVVLALWPVVEKQGLLLWLLVLWSILAVRYVFARQFLKLCRGGNGFEPSQWLSAYVVGAVATGLCWGLTIFYFPQSPLDQTTILLVFVIAGVSAFASATMATIPLASNLFMLSTLLPVALWLFSYDQRLNHIMAMIALVYLGVMLLHSRHLQRVAMSALVSAEQNRELTLVAQEGELRYRSQSNLLQSVLESAADVSVWALDRDYRYLMFNAKYRDNIKRLRGVDITVGMSALDVIEREELRAVCRQKYDQILQGHSTTVESREEVMQDERLIYEYYEDHGSPIRNDDGEVVGLTIMTLDITERRRMASELTDSHNFLNTVINSISDQISVKDSEHRWVLLNDVCCTLIGHPREVLLGKSDYDFLPKEQADVFWEKDDLVFVSGEVNVNEEVITSAAGITRHLLTQKSPFTFSDGKRYVVATSRDITERKLMEAALAARELEFRTLAENAPDPIYRYDRNCRRIYANAAVERLTGKPVAQLLGKSPIEFVPNSSVNAVNVQRVIQQVLDSGESGELEVRFTATDGREVVIHNLMVPEFDGQGLVQGVLCVGRDVTERKAMERAMRDSQWMLQEAQRIAHIGSWDVDIANDKLTWSDEIFRIWEIDKTQFKADFAAFLDTVHPQDRDRVVQTYNYAIQNHSLYQVEHRLLFPDGRVKYILEQGEPQYDAQGKPVRFIGSSLDITERKQAEEKMALLSNALDQADPAFLMENGRIVYVNQATCRALEYSEDELIGKHIEEIDSHLSPELAEQIGQALDSSGSFLFESRHRTKHGRTFPVEISATVMNFGGKDRTLSLARDITDRKQAQTAIEETRNRLQMVLQTIPDLVWLKSVDGVYLACNPTFERFFGAAETDILGKTDYDFVDAELADFFRAKDRKAIDSGRACLNEEWVTFADDERRVLLETRKVPLFDAAGKVVSVLGIGHDITERKQGERALQERLEEISALNRTLEENAWLLEDQATELEASQVQIRNALEFTEGIINAIPDILFEMDRNGRYLNVWTQNSELLLEQKMAIQGRTVSEVLAPESAAIAMASLREADKQGFSYGNTLPIVQVNGETRWYEHSMAKKHGSGSSEPTFIVLARDITERKRMADELRLREREFRTLVDSLPDPFFRYDREGRRTYVNAQVERISGTTATSLLGQTLAQSRLASPHWNATLERDIRQVLSIGQALDGELEYQAPDGRTIHYASRLGPVFDDQGEVSSVMLLLHDVTEIKVSELKLKDALEFSEGIINAIPDLLLEVDRQGRHLGIWAQNPELLVTSKEEMLGLTIGEVLSPENAATLMDAIRQAEVHGLSTAKPISIDLPQGSRWFEHTVSRKPGGTKANARFLMLSRDITERKRMEEALAAREFESRTLIENTPDVITRFDRNCLRIFGNKALDDVIEGGLKAILGKRPSEMPGGVAGEIYESKLREVISTGVNTEFELAWPNKRGLINHSHFRLVAEVDASGAVATVLAVARDITELNAFREKIHQMAFYDSLTSLPNRALFNDRLRQMLTDAAWHSQHAGVMLLDLDRFKAINDSLGHPAGDALLREAALRLSFCVRGYDTVARLGGDEFAVLLPQMRNADDLGRVASKILASFNEPFMLDGKEIFISTSIGIAVFPDDSSDADDLVKQADSAMYFAKRSGRNNFRFYSKDLTASAGERLALESELRHAVERHELELYYQPKVRLADNTLVGSEALLRWIHPQRGLVPPDHFISIAEDCGLIVEIGEWVLRDACRTACDWNAVDKPLHKIAVNLSARQFQSNDLVKTVKAVLKETGCQPEWLELEITESLLLDEDGKVLETLETFRAMGISIAIDDFGTGYSSLSYLARFPITTLKIDRSFIHTVTTEHFRAELVKAILSIARCLGQEVVAEGVETLEQAAFLQANGCLIGQGYLYSKPVPKAVFAAMNLSPVYG
jgi:diguanylate cyclase (GGDEF)-like protein/PAS domain S-box-containing protein